MTKGVVGFQRCDYMGEIEDKGQFSKRDYCPIILK
jgi:hypothetical protein